MTVIYKDFKTAESFLSETTSDTFDELEYIAESD